MKRNSSIIIGVAVLAMCHLATSAFASAWQDQILANGPVAYWEFNEADGTSYALATVPGGQTAPPAVGSDAFRYLNSALSAEVPKVGGAGIAGRSLALAESIPANGIGYLQQVYGNGTTAINPFQPTDFSVEFWYKPTTSTMRLGMNAAGSHSFSGDWTSGSGSPYIGLFQGGTERFNTGETGPTAAMGQWSHIVFTFTQDTGDATKGEAKYYLNGALGGTKTLTGLPIPSARGPWTQFAASGSGYLDELAIYDYALSASQVFTDFSIPEPSSVALLGVGALLLWRRKLGRE